MGVHNVEMIYEESQAKRISFYCPFKRVRRGGLGKVAPYHQGSHTAARTWEFKVVHI
jgi:hypothetical protein